MFIREPQEPRRTRARTTPWNAYCDYCPVSRIPLHHAHRAKTSVERDVPWIHIPEKDKGSARGMLRKFFLNTDGTGGRRWHFPLL